MALRAGSPDLQHIGLARLHLSSGVGPSGIENRLPYLQHVNLGGCEHRPATKNLRGIERGSPSKFAAHQPWSFA